MYCPSCGAQNDDQARNCSECGENLVGRPAEKRPAPPPNYLVHSILVTLFCCLPLGIVAIVNAAQVDSKHASGDYEGAAMASQNAYKFMTYGIYGGLAIVLLYIGLIVLQAAS